MNRCIACQKETKNPKFCCRVCSASYNNTLYPKRSKKSTDIPKTLYTIKCPTCQKDFTPKRSISQYCSKKCSEFHRTLLFIQKVDETGYFFINDNTPRNTRTTRKYLIYKHGNNCMLCGQAGEDWKGKPLTLIVDHIDGHSTNWVISNIQLVCPNCDSQLSTYKGRNKGNSTRKYTITQK